MLARACSRATVSDRHTESQQDVSKRYATFVARTVSARPLCRSTDTCQPE